MTSIYEWAAQLAPAPVPVPEFALWLLNSSGHKYAKYQHINEESGPVFNLVLLEYKDLSEKDKQSLENKKDFAKSLRETQEARTRACQAALENFVGNSEYDPVKICKILQDAGVNVKIGEAQ